MYSLPARAQENGLKFIIFVIYVFVITSQKENHWKQRGGRPILCSSIIIEYSLCGIHIGYSYMRYSIFLFSNSLFICGILYSLFICVIRGFLIEYRMSTFISNIELVHITCAIRFESQVNLFTKNAAKRRRSGE